MKNRLLVILFLLAAPIITVRAINNTAIANNGNWSAAGTWSLGRAPANNDNIIIPAAITVNVDVNSPTYSGMAINVYGTLNFGNGQKINLDCDGYVYLAPTGTLSGGTPGSKINICGSTVWNGPGPTGGPTSFGSEPLPIELLSFNAKIFDSNKVKLEWVTATEENNAFFTIERSRNGATFEEVARINGAGNSTTQRSYSAIDREPMEGTSYYRLKQTDLDGTSEHFQLAAVDFKITGNGCVLKVYPNPCMGQCNVELAECDNDESPEIAVEVIDAAGNKVYTRVPERDSKGSFSLSIDTGNNLKPGVYIVRGVSKSEQYNKKVIVK